MKVIRKNANRREFRSILFLNRICNIGNSLRMKEYGLYDLVPTMCHLDYTMSEAGGTSDFLREYTIASGGAYCDCGYKKKAKI